MIPRVSHPLTANFELNDLNNKMLTQEQTRKHGSRMRTDRASGFHSRWGGGYTIPIVYPIPWVYPSPRVYPTPQVYLPPGYTLPYRTWYQRCPTLSAKRTWYQVYPTPGKGLELGRLYPPCEQIDRHL